MSAEQKPSQEKMLNTIKKHERLIELAKKLNSLGKITEVIFTSLSDVIMPSEKIMVCYYELQTGQRYLENGTTVPQFYSCDLNILTDINYLSLNFAPTSHTIQIKNVDHISELNIQKLFGSKYDEDSEFGAELNGFNPTQIKISYVFNNSRGEKVATWDIDTMNEENIKMILSQTNSLAQHIGKPLAKVQL